MNMLYNISRNANNLWITHSDNFCVRASASSKPTAVLLQVSCYHFSPPLLLFLLTQCSLYMNHYGMVFSKCLAPNIVTLANNGRVKITGFTSNHLWISITYNKMPDTSLHHSLMWKNMRIHLLCEIACIRDAFAKGRKCSSSSLLTSHSNYQCVTKAKMKMLKQKRLQEPLKMVLLFDYTSPCGYV